MPFFSVEQQNIHYQCHGRGPAIVLIHGFLENLGMWDELSQMLAEQYQIVRIDLPGFGLSDGFTNYSPSMADYASVVLQLCTHLKLKKYNLIGHSMGGYIALEMAAKQHENIRQLVLFHATARPDNNDKKANRDRAIKALYSKKNVYLSSAIKQLFPQKLRPSYKDAMNHLSKEAKKLLPESIKQALWAMRQRKDHWHTQALLNKRCHTIAGALDPILDSKQLAMDAYSANSHFYLLQNAGHMSHIEQKNDAFKAILGAITYV